MEDAKIAQFCGCIGIVVQSYNNKRALFVIKKGFCVNLL
jgi:hypothetical protein